MAFDGNEGDWITLADAQSMASSYRQKFPNEKRGAFLGIDKINTILAQNDCMGIRVYFAKNAADELTIIMIGADSREQDLTGYILDVAQPCPPLCGSI